MCTASYYYALYPVFEEQYHWSCSAFWQLLHLGNEIEGHEDKKTLDITCILNWRRSDKQYNSTYIVHTYKEISCLAQAAETFVCCRAFGGHGFLIASCIFTMQPFGPLTEPLTTTMPFSASTLRTFKF